MCGIAGFIHGGGRGSAEEMLHCIDEMTDSLKHRGPDDRGVWTDKVAGVALGHRRLSIVDLSPGGHQPMFSASGRFIIVFNGEIYNFLELRTELEQAGHCFRSHSDTEVMLAGFERWGIQASLNRFNGMFAFAVWDREERTLVLGRDPLGKKPLYYGWIGQTFLFASELKSLRMHPHFDDTIDHCALSQYFRFNCIPAPSSIYKNIRKLPSASLVEVKTEGIGIAEPRRYWSLAEVAASGVASPWRGSTVEAIEEAERILSDAVRLRSIADVPLGAFLSGGIDSSLIVALMQREHSGPVRTFSIGLENPSLNESFHAEAVASHLRTQHTSLCVTAREAMAVIPKMAQVYDEPFSDSSQIPAYLVSQLARGYVTVALSGDGGDELFGGYNRHQWVGRFWRRVGWLPTSLRRSVATAVSTISPDGWDRIYTAATRILPERLRLVSAGDKIHKIAAVAGVANPTEMYLALLSHWRAPNEIVLSGTEYSVEMRASSERFSNVAQEMMLLDTLNYLHDDILVKVDRASMSQGLEVRSPFLDRRLVAFSWTLPLEYKIRQSTGKWILREILHKYVPRELVDRPKSGFGVPLGEWLRGPLREWAASLLDPVRLRAGGLLNEVPIEQKWNEHLSCRKNWAYDLWDVLMFESWLEAARGHVEVKRELACS